MKKTIYTIILSASVSFSALAQGGRDAMPFMVIDRSPATLAMAGAGSATGIGAAWSAFDNSAVLPFLSGRGDAAASWQNWAPKGVKSSNIGAGAAMKFSGKAGVSVGAAYQMGNEYTIYSESGTPGGSFKPSDMLVNLGVGFAVTDFLSLGVNARLGSQKLSAKTSYTGIAADADVLYRKDALSASAGVHNIGTKVASAYSLPTSARVAGAYEAGAVTAALDVDYFFSGGLAAAVGVQYSYNDMVFARAGYHYGSAGVVLPSFASVGVGAKFAGVHVDVAFLLGGTLGNTLSAGLGYAF